MLPVLLLTAFVQLTLATDISTTSTSSSTSSIYTDTSSTVSPSLSAPQTSSTFSTSEASLLLAPAEASPSSGADVVVLSDGSEAIFVLPSSASIVVGNTTMVSINGTTSDDSSESDEAGDSNLSTQGFRPLVMGYYPSWKSGTFPPEQVPWDKYDWVDFAFALPNASYGISWDDPNTPSLLRRLVASAHAKNKKVKLSIGGWTGSKYFSSAVSEENRHTFAQNIVSTYSNFSLDGIDIDWEYPGRDGNTGNEISPQDTDNYLKFLQLLRSMLPRAKITAAVSDTPFADSSGQPTQDVSAFAEVLDWVLIMNYDVWQSSPNPGPNAPLYDGCNNSTQPEANVVAAFNAWTSAKFPAAKLVLGVPSYGYVSNSNASHLSTRASSSSRVVDDDGQSEGSVSFNALINQGALVAQSGPNGRTFVGSNGFIRYWDKCSATPFLRSEAASQIIAYDDTESLGMKAAFVKRAGMLGTNMFEVTADTSNFDLIVAIRKSLGYR